MVTVYHDETLAAEHDESDFFEARIRPILVERCYQCHNSTTRAEGGLALDYRDGIRKGGDLGPSINLEHANASRLLLALRHEGDLRMPQDGPKLSPRVIADFSRWVENGAFDPRDQPPSEAEIEVVISWEAIRERRKRWWSFQPISVTQQPKVRDSAWSEHAIDQFLLARLERAELKPGSAADRNTLIRRVTFALTGLPPTISEVENFVADESTDAYEQVVDRLLESPRFGERWARHWMDWFRYADSHGSEGDPIIPNAWRYRDYLIRALNVDVPYDQLVREHVAGDLLVDPRVNNELGLNESAIGISHFRLVEHGYAPTDALEELVRTTDNQIDVLSKALLGLTVSCARCHDHKFDPISQADFYSLYGILVSCRPAQVTVDSKVRQALYKQELRSLKADIKQRLAESWLGNIDRVAQLLDSAPNPLPLAKQKNAGTTQLAIEQRRVNEALDQGLQNPLYPWVRIRSSNNNDISKVWKSFAGEWQQSLARLEGRRASDYALHWDANSIDSGRWYRHGNGMDEGSVRAGAFHLATEKDRIVANIYPAGVYSHLVSSKHSGQFTSPSFPVNAKSIWIRALGSKARARYVMHHYPRAIGPIYAKHRLEADDFRWLQWDLEYWHGDQAYLEFATNRDLPVEAGGHKRSWFGVSEVIAVREGETTPQQEPAEYVSPLFLVAGDNSLASQKQLLEWYTGALRQCIEAWESDAMTDEQANFLSFFVRQELLQNTLTELPGIAPLATEYRRLESEIPVPTRAPGVLEAGVSDHPLFLRGDHKQPGPAVPRRFLEVFDPKRFDTTGSGRLRLADAILAANNPLTPRVIVNRVWHHLFGRGIVATTDNFGHLGELPTHPELLDYLAKRFVDEDYSLKKLIRLLATSRGYRLDSATRPDDMHIDSDNHLLSHMRVRRLEAEALRDTLLQLSGQLDLSMYGPPVEGEAPRRGVYVWIRRNALDPFMSVFDAPAPFSTTGRRAVTNVPAQSLVMMNNDFVRLCAEQWGERIASDRTLTDDRSRIDRFFLEAFARRATPKEHATTINYLRQLRRSQPSDAQDVFVWRELAHAIVGFKEFAYIR